MLKSCAHATRSYENTGNNSKNGRNKQATTQLLVSLQSLQYLLWLPITVAGQYKPIGAPDSQTREICLKSDADPHSFCSENFF